MLCFTFASNDDSLDRKEFSVDEMYNRVIDKTQNGSIILFHNGVENTPEALDKILTKLKKDSYKSVTVSELFLGIIMKLTIGAGKYQVVAISTSLA